MDEVAKIDLVDVAEGFAIMRPLDMPTTINHWQSASFNPHIFIDFDEPVKIFDVVLKPKFDVYDAPSDFMQSQAGGDVFANVGPEFFNFKNLDLTEGGRLKPEMMTESFKSIE